MAATCRTRLLRLTLDRGRRQAADMRGCYDVRQLRKRRHLVRRADDVHRSAGDAVLA
jgi:hypothetical protein